MFGFFDSQEKRARQNASNWIQLARRVWEFRRDAISGDEADELNARRADLQRLLAERADAARLKLGMEALEGVLRRTGGALYPKTSLSENVEFLLVAAIVILGMRTYFVQPFKIPTNSMWPSYYGMTGENVPTGPGAHGFLERTFRLFAFGAEQFEMIAPRDGEITVPFFARTRDIAYTIRNGRSWLVIPSQYREYTFYVGGAPVSVEVPVDFSQFNELFMARYFPDPTKLAERFRKAAGDGEVEEAIQRISENSQDVAEIRRIPLGSIARAGDVLMRFDLLTGDQLVVDRMSYNFVRPRVGQGFVFRTGHIPGLGQDQYFVKRLIGGPGDRIEIREPAVWRNGAPITGSEAFELNARRVSPYRGYFNASHDDSRFTQLFNGQVVTVPPGRYLALGDNSRDSLDGRYWGFVPAKDVVGNPLFVYYPFTSRWGAAR